MAFAVSRKALNVQAKKGGSKGGSKTTKVCDKSVKIAAQQQPIQQLAVDLLLCPRRGWCSTLVSPHLRSLQPARCIREHEALALNAWHLHLDRACSACVT